MRSDGTRPGPANASPIDSVPGRLACAYGASAAGPPPYRASISRLHRSQLMLPSLSQRALRALSVLSLAGMCASIHAAPFPNPATDSQLAKAKATETAVLAGGCFWGVEAVFEHVKGVV